MSFEPTISQNGLIELLQDYDITRSIFRDGCRSNQISQETISKHSGISREALTEWENGGNNLSKAQIKMIVEMSQGIFLDTPPL